MEQIVIVHRLLENGQAEVLHTRRSACSGDCRHCSGCGEGEQKLLLRADNPIGAPVGAEVRVESASSFVLGTAALVYGLPLGLFFLGYGLAAALGRNGPGWACLGFALGMGLAVALGRSGRQQKTCYTITGYAFPQEAADSKGEHQLG